MASKRLVSSLVLAMSISLASSAQAFAPIHRLTPKKVVSLALSHPKAYALKLLTLKGIAKEYGCLVSLWNRESHWNYKANNPYSTAYGIWQGLTETSHDPATQIRNGLRYIGYRYAGSPCRALAWHTSRGWY